jgi:hypothetical protein
VQRWYHATPTANFVPNNNEKSIYNRHKIVHRVPQIGLPVIFILLCLTLHVPGAVLVLWTGAEWALATAMQCKATKRDGSTHTKLLYTNTTCTSEQCVNNTGGKEKCCPGHHAINTKEHCTGQHLRLFRASSATSIKLSSESSGVVLKYYLILKLKLTIGREDR